MVCESAGASPTLTVRRRAVVAYIHMMHGKDTQLAPMGAKDAEAICTELLKQAGRSGAAPLPSLAGRLASDAPQMMRENPPSPKDWHTAAEACQAPAEVRELFWTECEVGGPESSC